MLLENTTDNLGWQAADFSLCDPDGKRYALSDLKGENGLLIVFMCNHCPYVKAVGQRLSEDASTLQTEGINVVGINSNDYQNYPDDSPANMKRFAAQYDLPFPYLVDEDQSVAKTYGAVCTPDFFGFNNKDELQYRGRLDDARLETAASRTPELVNAMKTIAATGKGPAQQLPSMGCSIKWRN